MTIDTAKERERLATAFYHYETSLCDCGWISDHEDTCRFTTFRSTSRAFSAALDVIDAQAAEIERLRETIGALKGAVNWLDALLELVEETSCDPENPEEFDEVMAGAALFGRRARAALSEHEP